MFFYLYFRHIPSDTAFLRNIDGWDRGIQRAIINARYNLANAVKKTHRAIAMAPDDECVMELHCDPQTFGKLIILKESIQYIQLASSRGDLAYFSIEAIATECETPSMKTLDYGPFLGIPIRLLETPLESSPIPNDPRLFQMRLAPPSPD